jgi:hypothetical protein
VYIIRDCLYPLLHLVSLYSSPIGTDSRLPSLALLGAPSSSQIHTTSSFPGFADGNNMKILNPSDCSVTPAIAVQSPHPRTPSLQTDVATLLEDKSPLQTHAYSRVGVNIKPGTYSRSLLRNAPRPQGQGLGCAGCTAVHSLGIDHCHKHASDKNGKGPHKRLRH